MSVEKNRLWNRCKQNPHDIKLKEEFRRLRNNLTGKIRLAKKRFHMTQLQQCGKNLRETWNIVNQIIGRPPKDNIDACI